MTRPRAWDYGLGVGFGYDSNIEFLVPDGPSSFGVVPRGNLARTFWSPKGELRLGATGYWTAYADAQNLSRYDLTFRLDGTYRSSPRTTWQANGSYSFGTSWSSTVLADQGVLLPVVPARTAAAGLGVTQSLGARTSLRLHGRAYATNFDRERVRAHRLHRRGSIRGTAGLDQRIGLRDTIGLEYSLENAIHATTLTGDAGRTSYLTHYGSARWTHLLSPGSGFLIEAGGSYTPNAEEAGLGQPRQFLRWRELQPHGQALEHRDVRPAGGDPRLRPRGQPARKPLRLDRIDPAGSRVDPRSIGYPRPARDARGCRLRLHDTQRGVCQAWPAARSHVRDSARGPIPPPSATDISPTLEGYQAGIFLSCSARAARPPAPASGR